MPANLGASDSQQQSPKRKTAVQCSESPLDFVVDGNHIPYFRLVGSS